MTEMPTMATEVYVDLEVPQPGLVVECAYVENGERHALRMTAVGGDMRFSSLEQLSSQLSGVEEVLIDSLSENREARLAK